VRRLVAVAVLFGALAAAGCGGGGSERSASGKPVTFAQVEKVFAKYSCASCHPVVTRSLDLRPGRAYRDLVGVRAVEDPRLVRVVAGDPDRSFLYQKVAGDPKLGDIPAIGARMPQGAPRMEQGDIDTIRDWILQGAKNAQGKTVGPRVPTPGAVLSPVGAEATRARGTGTITGVVQDDRRRPLPHALVTLLLRSQRQPGGEEHYRVAETDASGRYTLPRAPAGRYLLKAYGPRSIYVSRIVALGKGDRAVIDFGLPSRVVPNPRISRPRVSSTATGTRLQITVAGSSLDPNYTLAVNPRAGLVFELHRPDTGPGVWSRTIGRRLAGRWIFLAVDHQCNISDFLVVS
jgi:hypothetical protein